MIVLLAELSPDPIASRFVLHRAVRKESSHGLGDIKGRQNEGLGAEELIIGWEVDFVVANRQVRHARAVVRRVRRVPGTAAVERAGVVNHAVSPIHESAIDRVVGVAFALAGRCAFGAPHVHVVRGDPETIRGQTARDLCFTEAHQAFLRWITVRESRAAAYQRRVYGRDIKRDQGVRGETRNRA